MNHRLLLSDYHSSAMIHRSTFLLLSFPMHCLAWSPSLRSHTFTSTSFRAPNFMSSEENFPDEMSMPGSAELTNNPCWQDIYDDDCSMSNIYAANFVASKWIKSMPCGAGIEVMNGTTYALIGTSSDRKSVV